jgi:hypothetical protein
MTTSSVKKWGSIERFAQRVSRHTARVRRTRCSRGFGNRAGTRRRSHERNRSGARRGQCRAVAHEGRSPEYNRRLCDCLEGVDSARYDATLVLDRLASWIRFRLERHGGYGIAGAFGQLVYGRDAASRFDARDVLAEGRQLFECDANVRSASLFAITKIGSPRG